MRTVQLLFLTFAMNSLPMLSHAQSASSTMLVSINVIQACSVSTGDAFSDDDDMNNDNIRCGSNNIHRTYRHKEHSRHQRNHDEFERDHDKLQLTTIEF